LLDRLGALSQTAAPSGREDELRAVVAERWRPFASEVRVDPLGNLFVRVGGSGRRVLVTAHLDEIGWVVRHITEHGFLLLDTAQGSRNAGPEPRHMVGHAALVLGREGVVAEGVVAAASGHVMTKEQMETPVGDWDDFFVDIGVESCEEAREAGVYVGSPVVFRTSARHVGRRIVGTAMDDRICLLAIELLLERIGGQSGVDLYVAATVQEENGLHGATALARVQRFDEVIALDVGLVGDIPTVGATRYAGRLGGGPIIVHKDARVAYHHALSWQLCDCADAAGIPWQHGVFAGYGSDGVAFVQAGMPTALLCVPTRYTHSPFEMVDPDDVDAMVGLLAAWISR
jgi:endoglucanase